MATNLLLDLRGIDTEPVTPAEYGSSPSLESLMGGMAMAETAASCSACSCCVVCCCCCCSG
ncbi:hypothetical protein HNP84_003365 [Thermocatellispora tengchongensis]|uniref:Uncharacterized protein n=1 Tax=Thermocatellispora tengchongensis TaxID=1073253 RepID=A0A840P3S8_9ACTN|nr:hypothetical protein [Thermocatellispora tengchongensis]MBB5133639.1 hypothetical protein [Thermocatellispora tengchongensis]